MLPGLATVKGPDRLFALAPLELTYDIRYTKM